MKKLLFILTTVLCISCEEVVTVDLETAAPRLVIDAAINWEKGTSGNLQTIKLTTTTGYYQNEIPKVSGATVFLTNSSNFVFNFIEKSNIVDGIYSCDNFVPVIGETYILTVLLNGQTYKAEEKLIASPKIIDVEQKNDLGLNNDEIGIKVNYNDFPVEDNFYLFRFDTPVNAFPEFQFSSDEFTQGNKDSFLYSNEDLKTGNKIDLTLYGISEIYYNYMKILLGNANGGSNGPFQVPPTRVRGNILNQTNPNNYAIGYFRLCEIDKLEYIVK